MRMRDVGRARGRVIIGVRDRSLRPRAPLITPILRSFCGPVADFVFVVLFYFGYYAVYVSSRLTGRAGILYRGRTGPEKVGPDNSRDGTGHPICSRRFHNK